MWYGHGRTCPIGRYGPVDKTLNSNSEESDPQEEVEEIINEVFGDLPLDSA